MKINKNERLGVIKFLWCHNGSSTGSSLNIVFSLKWSDFSELCSACVWPAIVYTLTPRGNRERPESGLYSKDLKKPTKFNEHPVKAWYSDFLYIYAYLQCIRLIIFRVTISCGCLQNYIFYISRDVKGGRRKIFPILFNFSYSIFLYFNVYLRCVRLMFLTGVHSLARL